MTRNIDDSICLKQYGAFLSGSLMALDHLPKKVHVKIISIRGYGDNPIYSRYLFYRVVFFLPQQTFFRVQLFN